MTTRSSSVRSIRRSRWPATAVRCCTTAADTPSSSADTVLTPARRRGVEILDDPNVDPQVRERAIADVTRSNRLLGGLRAATEAVLGALPGRTDTTLLDIGTGLADIPAAARAIARLRGVAITTVGIDEAPSLLAAAGDRLDLRVAADALALPFRDHCIDVVICSQVLHHFEDAEAERLIREMNRVARHGAIVADLRRSWVAAVGFWLISYPFRFHRVTRHDGVVSVLRGFTRNDLQRLIRAATGTTPVVHRHLGFRLIAQWRPTA
ncbi:MAG TPA: methyltransferase domain-containing protein [Gemmatimonadaceae bacterium]|nr:methyltransferase domain-containing protein [Gemmatimonadaceae bacterium]